MFWLLVVVNLGLFGLVMKCICVLVVVWCCMMFRVVLVELLLIMWILVILWVVCSWVR